MQKPKGRECELLLMMLNFPWHVSKSSRLHQILVGSPRKGQAPTQVTLWSLRPFPTCKYVSAVFTMVFLAKTCGSHVPKVQARGQTTNMVCMISQDYKASSVQVWCVQTLGGKRYTNLTKH